MTSTPANRGAGEGGTVAERAHPDLFTEEQAAAYLRVTTAQLPTLEKDYGLKAWKIGRVNVYHRMDLDATACRMVGLRPPAELCRPLELRMAK